MIVAFEFHDGAAAGGGAGEAHGGLGDFGAGRAEAQALGAGDAFADDAGGLVFDRRLAGEENALFDLLLDGCLHACGAMAEDHGAHAAIIVDDLVAIDVIEIGAFAMGEHQGPVAHAQAEIAVHAAGHIARLGRDDACGLFKFQHVLLLEFCGCRTHQCASAVNEVPFRQTE